MKRIGIAIVSVALLSAAAAPAWAQAQSKAQQACLNKVVKTAGKVAGAVLKDASKCIKKGATGSLSGTADACVVGDLKGKVTKATGKLDAAAAKSCMSTPDFGFIDSGTAGDAYVYDNEVMSIDGFGTDLDAALLASDAVDPSGRCSSTLPSVWRKLEDAMHRAVAACLKDGLKAGTITSEAGYEACYDSIMADTRGRVAKSVALVQSKLTSSCPSGDLAGIFPGLVPVCAAYSHPTDAAGIAACSRDRLECRVCRIFNFAWGLYRDCDLFDDGVSNSSCPECGNGVTDAGEECDDGNTASGDGCTAQCLDEYCGDGTVNDAGAEQCDDGNANSDTTPDACRTDCQDPFCGDGVVDPGNGEQCDDGNTNDADGCTNQCTRCGDGVTAGSEQCDDGNTADGDCCSSACTFEAMGTSCTGAPSSTCTAPGCDGAGACVELPANEGTPCDDGDECSNASECQSGACTTTSYVVTGPACRWVVVGNPTTGSGGTRRIDFTQSGTSNGDWCGDFAQLGDSIVLNGDLVVTEGDASTPGAELDALADVSAGDVVSNNALVDGLAGDILPGLAVTSVAAGQHVLKTPNPTFYDTTGTDPRVAQCQAAQLAISTNTASQLDGLTRDANLGATLTSLAASATATINPVNIGSLNVIDVDNITGGTGVTLNIDGGGDANTVMIIRVQNTLNTNVGWHINLTGNLTADHLLIYGKGSGTSKCEIGQDNVGAGTIFCPSSRIHLILRTVWSGALYGGGTSAVAIDVGQNVQLTHVRFNGF